MPGADERTEIPIPGLETKQIIADAVRDDPELFRRFLELGTMDAHQLQLALKNAVVSTTKDGCSN